MKNVGGRKGWAKRELGKGREMDWRLGGGGGGGRYYLVTAVDRGYTIGID